MYCIDFVTSCLCNLDNALKFDLELVIKMKEPKDL